MMPPKSFIDQQVDNNMKEMFKGIKLSKVAEGKVRRLMEDAIGMAIKLQKFHKFHNELAEAYNTVSKILEHSYTEVQNESKNQEAQ